MRDFNFFQPFEQEIRKEVSKDSNILILVLAGVLALSVAILLVNSMRIASIQKSITEIDANMNDEGFKSKLVLIEKKQVVLDELVEDDSFFEAIGKAMEKRNRVNVAAVKLIEDQVPNNLHLTELLIKNKQVDIVGKTNSKVAVAQFQHNFRETEDFADIFVSELKKEEAYYKFKIMLKVKEDETDEK